MITLQYNRAQFPFSEIVQQALGVPLPRLHTVITRPTLTEPAHDQDTHWHRQVYSRLPSEFFDRYRRFAQDVAHLYLEPQDWLVQAVPTFRFQLPGGTGTTEFHRDADYGHSSQTINVLVPLTPMAETTALLVQPAPFVNRYEPAYLDVGDFLIFHAALCRHGTRKNVEMYTRVSFDFRFVPRAHQPAPGTTSITQHIPLADGHYYRALSPWNGQDHQDEQTEERDQNEGF